MKKQEQPPPFIINDTAVQPGERKLIMLPMPKLYDWTPLYMPVHVIHSKIPGPVLCVTAAIHGDEVNGVEIVRRLLKRPALKKIMGTLMAVPIVNVYGFLYQDRYLMDRRDLNRCFPGSKNGSLASRLAHLLVTELISKATHCIDLHTGSFHRSNLPQVRASLSTPEMKKLAKAFDVPIIIDAKERDGSLREYAVDKGIPMLLYEAGEALRFNELPIRTGINGILNVMDALKMLTLKKHRVKNLTPALARSSYWVRASHSGILHPFKSIGKQVKKNELLAVIANPTTNEEHKLMSPLSGIIIGQSHLPLVHAGAALFHIASFKELTHVEEQIQVMHETYDDNPDKDTMEGE